MVAGPQAALLVLEDGSSYLGTGAGAPGEAFGEVVFNTGMTGYQEVLSDPSYRGQLVVMTYPEIGICGINDEDPESDDVQVAGFVVHRAVDGAFNWRATRSLTEYLQQAGVVALQGVDTRALTRHIRTQGAMRAGISTVDLVRESLLERVRRSPGIVGVDLVEGLKPRTDAASLPAGNGNLHVAVVDAGAKSGIVRQLLRRGVSVSFVRYTADVEEVVSLEPDGVVVSNGPGDPAALRQAICLIRGLLERRIPLAGICLGHQLLALALGCHTYKMQFGHRGINHPVKDLETGRVLVTTQNHGFAVDPTSLGIPWEPLDAGFSPVREDVIPRSGRREDTSLTMAELLPSDPLMGTSPLEFGPVEITHLSLNDGTIEGIRLQDLPAFSVQFHPEASPGPHDAADFFGRFIGMMEVKSA